MTQNLSGSKKSHQDNIISPESWIEHFSMLNKKNPSDLRDSNGQIGAIIDEVSTKLNTGNNNFACHILDRKFSREEVMFGIKKLKSGKASGCDAISNDIIKASADEVVDILVDIFDRLRELEHYPIQWATGLLMPLHKAGDLNEPNNYRGITINSCLSKLFTLLLNERLTEFCEVNKIIEYNQAGFRKGFRTSDQVFTLKTLVDQSFANGKKLYTCFVDFKKAYDMVWRDGLYFKLLHNRISPKFIRLIRDMYSRLQACIRLPNGISTPFPSLIGLKQGCNLSPILFNIFINDLINDLNKEETDAPKLDQMNIKCLLYADDLVIVSESQEGLQKSMDILEAFTQKWHLQVNISKTKCLTFLRGRRPTIPPSIHLGDTPVQNCASYCYLGTVFSESGSLNLAAKTLSDKARSAMYALLKNLYKHRICSIELLFDFFDKLVAPVALYNSEVWGTTCIPSNPNNNSLLDQEKIYKYPIECLQGKFIKRVLGVRDNTSNWAVYSEVGKQPIILKIFNALLRFLSHLQGTHSNILTAALKVNMEIADKGFNSWYSGIKKLLNFCNISVNSAQFKQDIASFLPKSKIFFKNKFLEEWEKKKNSIDNNSKLEFYASYKTHFVMEKYLSILDFKLRNAITKLRVSAHRLPIETGRYHKTPTIERTCTLCGNGVGDEIHYLLHCTDEQQTLARGPILDRIASLKSGFDNMDEVDKCKFILSSDNPQQIKNAGMLCMKIQEIFKEKMDSIEIPKTQ
jgi:hypothetical protein